MSVWDDVQPRDLRGILSEWGAIARVTIATPHAEYPLRTGDRVRYPIGTYTTTLAGPELARLAAERGIVAIHTLARYEMGRPLADIARHLIDERVAATARGDEMAASRAKLMANALGGKFAQRAGRWVPDARLRPPEMWGEWLDHQGDGMPPTRCRAIAGVGYRREESRRGNSLLCAIYCYLTSYGRCQMRDVREALPTQSVLSQDTDGLWVTDDGLAAARSSGLLDRDEPGHLTLRESVDYARFLSPRHYVAGTEWTLAGIAVGRTWDASGQVVESLCLNPIRFGPRAAPGAMTHIVRTVDLAGIVPDVPVDADTGWARPWQIGVDIVPWD